jgi:hypothetical protein
MSPPTKIHSYKAILSLEPVTWVLKLYSIRKYATRLFCLQHEKMIITLGRAQCQNSFWDNFFDSTRPGLHRNSPYSSSFRMQFKPNYTHVRSMQTTLCLKPKSVQKYRVRINYWTISLDHILGWKCAMILKFVSNTTQWTYIWNGLNAAKAISREKHTSFDKMAALPTERSWCALEFARSNSVVAVQQAFWRQFGRRGPPALSIWRWYEQFRDRDCICHQGKGRAGRPSVTEKTVGRVRESFVRSPRKSVSRARAEEE